MTSRAEDVSARSVLGVPFIPPVLVSEQSTRLRNMFGRAHRMMAPPPLQILESALSLLDHRVLVALCAAGVPDALDAPIGVDELAVVLSVDRDRLDRLVRYASPRGWLRVDRAGRVRPTAVTAFLRSDHPAGWRAWVDFVGGADVVAAISALDLRRNDDVFARVNGAPFFKWLESRPARWATFDAAMSAGGRMHALMLDASVRWRGVRSVCDVGGGTGELLRVLLDRHPEWTGTVFDLPEVIGRARKHPRLVALAGDMFASVPGEHDAYLLVNVLHDWSDDDASRIVQSVARDSGPSARIFIVENDRRRVPHDDISLRSDVLMASLTNGGRERTGAEIEAIAAGAGLDRVKKSRLGSGDLVYELRHPGGARRRCGRRRSVSSY